ncbi:MAG: site-specific DNA-methyltransferase, partial [Gammaproteobacteria bacterium]|nr:site-specific DNA-methyltransferase [Gammaproteobacteria bacterium]
MLPLFADRFELHVGEALEHLHAMPDNSVDSMVTDPPSGIGFMGAEWDRNRGGFDLWVKWLAEILRESYRVIKPGGHGLIWALPKTSHWTGNAIEQSGFEVRDVVTHLFGSGMPKGRN